MASAHARALRALAAAAAGVYAVLAVLVSLGKLDDVDSYAARHLMPGLSPRQETSSLLDDLLPYHGHGLTAGDVIRLPAGILPATALVVVLAVVLWRRGRQRTAEVWVAAFAVANLVEVLCKKTITRPSIDVPVHAMLVHVVGFDSSYPSGHALRAAVLAAAAAAVWPRARLILGLWVAVVVVTLEVDGRHTPSDLLGGLLLACVLVPAAMLLERRLVGEPRRDSVARPRRS